MPLASGDFLAPHFTARELGADQPSASPGIVANLSRVAQWLEAARAILGVPLDVTNGYRTPAHNAAVGGSATSDHPNGLAADFIPRGLSLRESYDRLHQAATDGQLPPFDQLILYPIQGHIHVGLGSRMRREWRINLYEGAGGTPLLTSDLVRRLPGAVASVAVDAAVQAAAAVSGVASLALPWVFALGAALILFILAI